MDTGSYRTVPGDEQKRQGRWESGLEHRCNNCYGKAHPKATSCGENLGETIVAHLKVAPPKYSSLTVTVFNLRPELNTFLETPPTS